MRKIVLALLVGVAACGGDSTGPGSIAGRYTLQTINGNPLPFVVNQVGADKIEITAAHINLNADLTCSENVTLRRTIGGNVSTEVKTDVGTYTINNQALTLTFVSKAPGGSITTSQIMLSITGSQLTLSQGGSVLIYRK